MEQPPSKRIWLTAEDVLLDIEGDDDEPIMPESDDVFKDIVCN